MGATVLGMDCGNVIVRTDQGICLAVHPWTSEDRVSHFPLRLGYARTLHKVQGATLPHVTVWLDVPNMPAAAYVALSRVEYDANWRFMGDPGVRHFTPPSIFISHMAVADRDLPTRALVVEPVWIEEILAGRKTWELRGQNCHLRGAVALAARGKLLGEVTFEQAMMVGERDAGGTLLAPQGRERDFLALPENVAQHRVENFTALPYSR
ncbi:pif1, partial [Symbiodinium necroappetens]